MARKSAVARQQKRERLVAKYAEKRRALKEAGEYQGLALLPRNSSPVRLHNRCKLDIPASNLKKAITKVLFDQGFIRRYKFLEEGPQGVIKIALKYDKVTKKPAITSITRASKPGLRKYTKVNNMPRVKNGLGVAIVSTPKGVMSDKNAIAEKVGGEVLCYVF